MHIVPVLIILTGPMSVLQVLLLSISCAAVVYLFRLDSNCKNVEGSNNRLLYSKIGITVYCFSAARFLFYITGHKPDFGSLQVASGFVGADTFQFNFAGTMLAINTFGHIPIGLLLLSVTNSLVHTNIDAQESFSDHDSVSLDEGNVNMHPGRDLDKGQCEASETVDFYRSTMTKIDQRLQSISQPKGNCSIVHEEDPLQDIRTVLLSSLSLADGVVGLLEEPSSTGGVSGSCSSGTTSSSSAIGLLSSLTRTSLGCWSWSEEGFWG